MHAAIGPIPRFCLGQALQSDDPVGQAPTPLPLIRQLIRGPDFAATVPPPADGRARKQK